MWLLKVIFNLKGTFNKTTKKNERNSAEASDNEHTKSADHLQIPLLSPKCIILYTVQHFSSELEAFHWAWIFLNDIFRYLDVCYYFHSGIGHRSKEQLFVKYSRKISYNKSISCPLSSIVLWSALLHLFLLCLLTLSIHMTLISHYPYLTFST